jgi:hypothetical protein
MSMISIEYERPILEEMYRLLLMNDSIFVRRIPTARSTYIQVKSRRVTTVDDTSLEFLIHYQTMTPFFFVVR